MEVVRRNNGSLILSKMVLRLNTHITQKCTEKVSLNAHTFDDRISTVFYCLIHSGRKKKNLKHYNRKPKNFLANWRKQGFSEVPNFTSSIHISTLCKSQYYMTTYV